VSPVVHPDALFAFNTFSPRDRLEKKATVALISPRGIGRVMDVDNDEYASSGGGGGETERNIGGGGGGKKNLYGSKGIGCYLLFGGLITE
jgi:hypothetical protein